MKIVLPLLRPKHWRAAVFLMFFVLLQFVSSAQDDTLPVTPGPIQVIDVHRLGHPTKDPNDQYRNVAGLGDIIVVHVKNLKRLLDKSTCVDSAGNPIEGCVKQEIRLFLDGRKITDLAPESGAPQKDSGILQFHLQRNEKNDEAWADLLGAPNGKKFWSRTTKVSVGLENGYAENTIVDNFELKRVNKNWFYACVIGLVVYLIALYLLARRSNVLRDGGIDASGIGIRRPDTMNGPYSLGRFQMAFWFSLVVACFMFIWLVTGNYDIITASVLGLIGISAGTSISSAVIDNSKGEELINKVKELQLEQATLSAGITDNQKLLAAVPAPDNAAALQADINTNQARILQLDMEIAKHKKALEPKGSRGFMLDVLSDVNGVSFHRLQMFVWTLVLGMLFLFSVWTRLAMPEFSATLLALQGLTAGTYLGFKIPEKNS